MTDPEDRERGRDDSTIRSFTLPIPVITVVLFTRQRDIMGGLVNRRLMTVAATVCATVIMLLNVVLVYQTFGGPVPF